MNLQSSVNRPFPATPGRSSYPNNNGDKANTARNAISIANEVPVISTTPSRRGTMTPSRYIPPSPLPGTSLGSQQTINPAFVPLQYRVVSNDGHLKTTMEQDKANADATLRALREGKSERRRKHEGLKIELLEEERWWENECERLRKEGAQIVKALEREKAEVAESQDTVTSLEHRRRNLAGHVDALKTDIDEWAAKVRARTEFNGQERKAFEKQVKKDISDLSFLEKVLGLKIQGLADDMVAFAFTLIDPEDHRRTFAFDLDASQANYTVKTCNPSLSREVVQSLVSKLDDTQNLFAFLKGARKAFEDLVRAERSVRRH